MLLRGFALVVLAASLAACGGARSATQASSLPPGCSAAEVQTIVTSFLAHPTVAPPGWFQLYGSKESDGRTFRTRRRAAAVAHARARLRLGERDRLIQLRVDPRDINHVGISFTITRYAPDFRARGIHTRIARGSGSVDCAHGLVASFVLNGP